MLHVLSHFLCPVVEIWIIISGMLVYLKLKNVHSGGGRGGGRGGGNYLFQSRYFFCPFVYLGYRTSQKG